VSAKNFALKIHKLVLRISCLQNLVTHTQM